jgi:hypothetical protein
MITVSCSYIIDEGIGHFVETTKANKLRMIEAKDRHLSRTYRLESSFVPCRESSITTFESMSVPNLFRARTRSDFPAQWIDWYFIHHVVAASTMDLEYMYITSDGVQTSRLRMTAVIDRVPKPE